MPAMKSPAEILESVIEDGRKELRRGGTGLAFSGLGAGLNISFSVIALAVIGSLTGGVGLAAIAAYPIGFLIVVLARAELYTENTVTPSARVTQELKQTTGHAAALGGDLRL